MGLACTVSTVRIQECAQQCCLHRRREVRGKDLLGGSLIFHLLTVWIFDFDQCRG